MKKYKNILFESGASLIELMLVIMGIFFLAMIIVNIPPSLSSITGSKYSSQATEIANRQVNYLRKNIYTKNLPDGTNTLSDYQLNSLPSSSASYEVAPCPSEVCQPEEKAKKVIVKVNWKESGEEKSVELVTLVAVGGLAQ